MCGELMLLSYFVLRHCIKRRCFGSRVLNGMVVGLLNCGTIFHGFAIAVNYLGASRGVVQLFSYDGCFSFNLMYVGGLYL